MKKTPLLFALMFLLTGCLAAPADNEEEPKVPQVEQPVNNDNQEDNNPSNETDDGDDNEEDNTQTGDDNNDTTGDEQPDNNNTGDNEDPNIDDTDTVPPSPNPEPDSEPEPDPTPDPVIPDEDEGDDELGYKLDCGYYQMDLPKNKTPFDLKTTLSADTSSWSNNNLLTRDDFFSTDFRFIYGNSCDDGPSGQKASPSFYQNEKGGLKMDQKNKGFQTQLFEHEGAKLEIRIGITQVNNANDKPEIGKETMGIYYFNKLGKYLGKHSVVEKTIETSTKEIKYYETASYTKDIAYFEVRLNAMAYKGQQCYNFGIGYCNFKSWERA